jgi:hypothetical protein
MATNGFEFVFLSFFFFSQAPPELDHAGNQRGFRKDELLQFLRVG